LSPCCRSSTATEEVTEEVTEGVIEGAIAAAIPLHATTANRRRIARAGRARGRAKTAGLLVGTVRDAMGTSFREYQCLETQTLYMLP